LIKAGSARKNRSSWARGYAGFNPFGIAAVSSAVNSKAHHRFSPVLLLSVFIGWNGYDGALYSHFFTKPPPLHFCKFDIGDFLYHFRLARGISEKKQNERFFPARSAILMVTIIQSFILSLNILPILMHQRLHSLRIDILDLCHRRLA
jgi:hypothetical protein